MRVKFSILLFCSMVVLTKAQIGPQPTEMPTIPPSPNTTVKPITTPAPSPTPTPSPSPTPTPSPSPTPTPSPSPKPTPSPSTKPTPSSATTSTTSVPPTTAKPSVDPPVNNFTVNYLNTTQACLKVNVAIEIEILGNKSSNSTIIKVPQSPTVTGKCSNATEQLTISWENNVIELNFNTTSSKKYEFQTIYVTLSGTNNTLVQYVYNKSAFATPITESYKCEKQQSLNLAKLDNDTVFGHLYLSHLHYQAFMNTTKSEFSTALDCSGVNTPDVVPIVVGCVLAILVVLVLVAYLFGRRRCQTREYLSM